MALVNVLDTLDGGKGSLPGNVGSWYMAFVALHDVSSGKVQDYDEV